MAYRKVYFRIRTDCYSSGWTSDADRTAFKEESRRLFQELGWAVTFGHNGSCDTAAKDQQDLYLHPSSFSGVIDEASMVNSFLYAFQLYLLHNHAKGENRCQPQKISARKSAWNCIKKSRRPEKNRA